MKKLITCMVLMLLSVGIWARSERQTVVFDVDIHCQGCIDKIEKNIAFERGVKDLRCNLQDRTVTVVFDPTKTDIETLQKAFTKIKKTATVRPTQAPQVANDAPTDAYTGASTPVQ